MSRALARKVPGHSGRSVTDVTRRAKFASKVNSKVTPEAAAEESLRTANNSYIAHVLDEVHEVMVDCDDDFVVRFCNDAYLASIGRTRDDVIGKSIFDYFPGFRESVFFEARELCQKEGKAALIGYSAIAKCWMFVRAFRHPGGTYILANRADESTVEQYQLSKEAVRDPLTRLPNKLALTLELTERLARDERFSLAMIGLNRFKTVNDTEGLTAGDQVLTDMASRLEGATRIGEILYRLNSDVFVLLLKSQGSVADNDALRRVMAPALCPVHVNNRSFVLGAAAGIVDAPSGGRDPETLIRHGALAMGEAKRSKRDTISKYRPGLDSQAELFEGARESWFEVDASWRVLDCNQTYLDAIGRARADVLGASTYDYIPNFSSTLLFPAMEACLISRKPTSGVGFSTELGRWIISRHFPLEHGGMMNRSADASDEDIERFELLNLSDLDDLTGLPGERALVQDIEDRLRNGMPFYLLLLDIGRFRTVNEIGGMAAGNRVLCEMASRLQVASDSGDRVFRLNSDLFPVLMRDDAHTFDQRVLALENCVTQAVMVSGREMILGARGGLVVARDNSRGADALIRHAALALKEAKKGGASRITAFEPSMERESDLRSILETELRTALASEQLTMYFQPKGTLANGQMSGAEALIRWNHPSWGLVPPIRFLPLAHDCGLMPELDRWVLAHVLERMKEFQQAGIRIPISINISAQSLSDPAFPEHLKSALDSSGVEPGLVDIELPEDTMMADVKASGRVLAELVALGLTISIDDFGTGYSSYASLARFPIRTMKIDRSFITDMDVNEINQTIVHGMIGLAHSLRLNVVAEGAETVEQMSMLEEMGCDEVQGYAYGRPLPFAEFCALASAKLRRAEAARQQDVTITWPPEVTS
jgi:diguanylate cyclase (GGDEF)-like protein